MSYDGNPRERDPLDMALTAAANVEVISTEAARIEAEGDPMDKLRLQQARPGKQAMDAAGFAARMAAVSLAADVRILREHFAGPAVIRPRPAKHGAAGAAEWLAEHAAARAASWRGLRDALADYEADHALTAEEEAAFARVRLVLGESAGEGD